ncbi:MAG: PDZ domain-containing protein [Kiritimatiellia bacterium]
MKPVPIYSTALLGGLLLSSLICDAQPANHRVPGLLRIVVTYQEQDPFQPWQRKQPGMRSGYGLLIGDKRILTTEALLRNQKLVELLKPESGEKFFATVEISDAQANLAVLRVTEPARLANLEAFSLCKEMPLDAHVKILQLDRSDRIQTNDGQVVEVTVAKLPNAPYHSLCFMVRTDLNVEAPGVPVLHEGKLAGLVMNYSRSSRIGEVIPYPVVQRFLDDLATPPYEGFATAGFVWGRLTDPTKRRYLKLRREGQGVLVLFCLPRSGADEHLKSEDVILAWDGEPVDNLGYYNDTRFGRLPLTHLIKMRRRPGEEVPVRISRMGAELDVGIRLRRYDDSEALIPENITGEDEAYLVEGGLILRELTGLYVKAHGANWPRSVGLRLAQLYLTQRYNSRFSGDRIVLLAGVLNDPINVGYESFRNEIVTAVNGIPVRNLADVFSVMERDGHIQRITLKSVGVDLALDTEKLDEANARIMQNYHIKTLRYPPRTAKEAN